LLIHDPLQAPRDFEGWVIHGHMHNNDLERYPFINFERRTINVSVEVIGYRPVPSTILCRIVRGDYGRKNILTYCHLARIQP
ncbi:MAG TPA: hypothetical protein VE134_06160, partial [Methanomicrobiales archaeon]|nr:hypothetical protein [Methanomicrobiales archaeon]